MWHSLDDFVERSWRLARAQPHEKRFIARRPRVVPQSLAPQTLDSALPDQVPNPSLYRFACPLREFRRDLSDWNLVGAQLADERIFALRPGFHRGSLFQKLPLRPMLDGPSHALSAVVLNESLLPE